MGSNTNIEWCDSTVNPTTGCDGCELWAGAVQACYAGNLHEARLSKTLPHLYDEDFTQVRLVPGRMKAAAGWADLRGKLRPEKPWLNGMPRTIFVGDMGDVFSAAVPFEFLKEELIGAATSRKGCRHIWQVLTKQPQRMVEFAEWLGFWPANIWAGTSVTSQAKAGRVEKLLQVPAAIHFVSAEPLWGPLSLMRFISHPTQRIRWVIGGGESSQRNEAPAKPMHPEWPRLLRDECAEHGVPFFFKQWGAYVYTPFRPEDEAVRAAHVNTVDQQGELWGWSWCAAGITRPGPAWACAAPDEDIWRDWGDAPFPTDQVIARWAGRQGAGRILDGRTHDGMPAMTQALAEAR